MYTLTHEYRSDERRILYRKRETNNEYANERTHE